MKILKLLIIGMAVAAFAALAVPMSSATTLNVATGTTITAEAEGSLTLHPPIGDTQCFGSKISGQTINAGGSTETVRVTLETFTETECNSEVTVIHPGELIIHTQETSANNNGTVTWNGTELTTTFAGFHCIFKTSETDVGTLTGSKTTGGNATLDIAGRIPRTGGRSGVFCGSEAEWTGSYKFTSCEKLNVDGESKCSAGGGEVKLSGEVPTGYVGETQTVTWKNTGTAGATISDETNSDATVLETSGSACTTIAAGASCTSRKVKCLKEGKATLTIRDTTANKEAQVTVNCDKTLTGEPTTGTVGQTVTVTWKNNSRAAVVIEDENTSNSEVAKTVGTGCETIAAGGSCTSRKIECLKVGESTITATDTPLVEGKFTIKCDNPVILSGEAPTGRIGETVTITWKNTGSGSATVSDETDSNSEVAKTVGTGCETIAAGGSCTSRKIECLKEGEATLTIRDTTVSPEAKGEVTVKCDSVLEGGPTTGKVGETVTVTWTNYSMGAVVIEDEATSDGTVAETLGSSCGEIAATGSCTTRKIKCLKAGSSTITAVDTPSIEGKFVIKCS